MERSAIQYLKKGEKKEIWSRMDFWNV